jgi:hypothetical protein
MLWLFVKKKIKLEYQMLYNSIIKLLKMSKNRIFFFKINIFYILKCFFNFKFLYIFFFLEFFRFYIPITKPVMPFPDLNTYRPEEYYEIPRTYDPIKD